MVALVTDVLTAEPISLHFTYLAADGSGKAAIATPRLYLKGHRKQGGVVRLHPDDEVTMGVIIGEGIESCLSAANELVPVWASLDAGNLGAFPLLPGIEALTVLVDNDPAGRNATAEVTARWQGAGREVIAIVPPIEGQDINDWLRGAA